MRRRTPALGSGCVRRDLILVPEAEAIRGYEHHHGLRESLKSGHVAANATIMMVRGRRQ
jgi:hypothetical protein